MNMTVHTSVEDGIARLTLSHPPLNILTRAVMATIREQIGILASERSLRVLVFQGEGKHFSAGADVAEHLPPDYEAMIPEFLDTIATIDNFPLPVIAAVRGRCLGGGFELVQPADFVIAGEGAKFGQPEIMLGVFPPAACVLLPRLATRSTAAEIVLTGDTIDAAEAHRRGLVWKVVADDCVEAEAGQLAERIARHSAAALRLSKRALKTRQLSDAGRIYTDALMRTADAAEGLRAFTEKRKPAWSHH
jgi:cyclohexa-1,5-dienecarbonyl-CoA hydratase